MTMRSETTTLSATPRTPRGAVSAFLFALASGAGLGACSADFHSDRRFEDMVCDETGCWLCRHGDCEEYRCDATHQCPMDRVCTTDGHCLPGGGTGGRCDSHDDCGDGQICTLEGQCVASPGGGPQDVQGPDTVAPDVAPDVAIDTGPADVGLPDHPDDTCRTNADCGAEGTCVNGGCYFPCTADARCPPAQTCVEGGCRPAPPENECTFNGECGTSHACLEGTCYQRCEETLQCPAHTRCATGICIADTTPVLQCSGAGSCGEGKACVDGKCLAACVDGACAAGFTCDLGYCARTASCFDAADCAGKDCVDGACTP